MASIRKRGKKYQAQIRRCNRQLISRTFIKKSDAQIWAREIECKLDRGDIHDKPKGLSNIRLGDVIERYLVEISVKKKSYDVEFFILNAFLRSDISKLYLNELKTSDFYDYRAARLNVVKIGTVQHELSIIKHALDVAKNEWSMPLSYNPLNNLKRLPVRNARNRRLHQEEFEAILKASAMTKNPVIMPIIEFALETAMRRGEILNIEWRDIDTLRRVLHIPLAKNGHERTIPLTTCATEILNNMNIYKRPFPITANALRMAWDRLTRRAGVTDLHFHDLRHEAISRFFEMGLSIPEVASISGHRDYRMLFRYTHLKPENLVNKINKQEKKP